MASSTVGLTLRAIREALADQIQEGVSRTIGCYPYPIQGLTGPRVEVVAAEGDYVSYWGTMGPNGDADILLDLKVTAVNASGKDAQIVLDDLLSAGQGNSSSIVDAIMRDPSLGGVVGNCVPLTADGPGEADGEEITALIHVQIITDKIQAEA